MKVLARSTASEAMPVQTEAQNRWAEGVMLSAWILS